MIMAPVLASGLCVHSALAQTATVETDHYSYLPQEAIKVTYRNGPGNPTDWIGVYPDGVVPGTQNSTIWQYTTGKEGVANFANGLNTMNDWKAFLLLNDGYDIGAETAFRVVDPNTPFARPTQRSYTPNQPITISFTNGPANPKDWIGIYPADRLPGNGNSLLWNYVDPANPGTVGLASGTITFSAGLPLGSYIAYFLVNDTYDVLFSEPFSVVPEPPAAARLLSFRPADGATNQVPLTAFQAVITNGTSRVLASGVKLKLDGNLVTPTFDDQTTSLIVSYTPTTPFLDKSTHTYELTFTDNAAVPVTTTKSLSFTVHRVDIQLPSPFFFENFDAVTEGQLPGGWIQTSYTDTVNPDFDLGNLDSASYATWVVVNASRFAGSFITYSDPNNPADWGTDYHRVLNYTPYYVVNGQVLNAMASGRVCFADSGYRNGTGQITYISTPDVDCSAKSDVYLSFHSIWEQNQDSMAGVEYSIDSGATWKPVLYMIDKADFINDDQGNFDVVATLNEPRGDVASYTNPDNGAVIGGSYGGFIGVPVDASLAPYVSGRVNDDSYESKRPELLRLPLADHQAKVRVRFFQSGTDSWYFGIDEVGLYSITADLPEIKLSIARNGNNLNLTWTGSGTFQLQKASSLTDSTWIDVGAATTSTSATETIGTGTAFYRVKQVQ